MVTTILLQRELRLIVDDEDAELAHSFKWIACHNNNGQYYAQTSFVVDGLPVTVRLHRVLLNAKPGEIVDHINGDTLDNRKANLRLCTRADNARNQRKMTGRTSSFKGVYRHAGRWCAVIHVNSRSIHLGRHINEEAAARAYDEAAQRLFGEFARLNFPKGGTA